MRDGKIHFAVTATRTTVACPLCQHPSERVHSHYQRTLLDLPWQGNAVLICATVRKFFCDNPNCKRRIFTEPFPQFAARYARKTQRLAEALRELTLLAGGQAATRIAKTFGLLLSADSLLDAVKKATPSNVPTPRVLGVDDFAFKRGRRYGTLLIDMERHCPIDLLPERSSSTLADWLKVHPGVEIVTRDRSTEFAKGITEGAPNAIQVADRFHLLLNLREALERVVDRHRSRLKGVELPTPGKEVVSRPRAPAQRTRMEQAVESARRGNRSKQHRQVHRLRGKGASILSIAKQLGISRSTVYHYLRTDEGSIQERTHRSSSILDPFVPYLSNRYESGCHNGVQLWREIRERGYPGARKMVAVWIAQQRKKDRAKPSSPEERVSVSNRTSSSRQFSWFLLRSMETLTPTEQAIRAEIETSCPALVKAGNLLRTRGSDCLDRWLRSASESKIAEIIMVPRI